MSERMDDVVTRSSMADLRAMLDLADPAVGASLMELARMQRLGVELTQEVVDRCVESHRTPAMANRKPQPPARRVARVGRSSVVYYMKLGDMVKIGTTTDLKTRRTCVGAELVLATEPGDERVERVRHSEFRHLRVHGEWFRHESPLTEHIAGLK